jgi:IS30 family transposase
MEQISEKLIIHTISCRTKEIKRIEKEINNRPVRKYEYLTPNEVFLQRR